MKGSWREGILESNLRILGGAQPGLAELLRGAEPEAWNLEPARSGDLTARSGDRRLHSAYDPRAEAVRLVSQAMGPATDTLVVLGAGLGYALEAALAVEGVERVLLCEAEPSRLAACLAAREFGPLLADPRLSWQVGGDPHAAIVALGDMGTRSIGTVGQRTLEEASSDWYAAVRAALHRFRAKEEINENTLKRFGRLWIRNLARNARVFVASPGIEGLADRFTGFPALVVAAGPSLDEILPLLPALRERCLIVAVDTALRSLRSVSVEPDFLVVVDPQYWNWRHVAGLDALDSFLVTEPAVFPPVVRRRHRRIFMADSFLPLGRALGGGRRGALGAGGSVATSAWDFARHLGASPIYMAGLDLGFPGGQTHAGASLFEQRALAAATRLGPAAGAQAGALFGAPTEMVPANDGGQVLSDQRMALYAWWFEARLARGDAPPTLSLASRGRAIPGMGLASAEDIGDCPPRRGEISRILDFAACLPSPEGGGEEARRTLGRIRADLEGIEAVAGEGRVAARRAKSALLAGRETATELDALARVDERLGESGARDIVGFLLPPLRELLGPPPKDLAGSLELSESLYAGIADSARLQLSLLDEALD